MSKIKKIDRVMEETKKTWIEDIKKGWEQIPNSVKFWNGLILLGLIISGFLGLDLLLTELAIMSVLALVLGLDAMGDDTKTLDYHIWIYFTPLAWFMLVVGLTIYGCIKLYENTITKFNNWLDKK